MIITIIQCVSVSILMTDDEQHAKFSQKCQSD